VQAPELEGCVRIARDGATRIGEWLQKATAGERESLEAGALDVAISLARTLALTLLTRHAAWALRAERDPRPAAAARRFAEHGVVRLKVNGREDTRMLASDSY